VRAFVSYAHRDRQVAEGIVDALRRVGVEASVDETVPVGGSWDETLVAAIREADAFVPLISSAAVENAWVMSELGAAIAGRKTVVPVLLSARPPATLPAPLRRWHFVRAAKRDTIEVATEIRDGITAALAPTT
jgi:hypothetical protein